MLSCIVEDLTDRIIILKPNKCVFFILAIKFDLALLDNAEITEKLSERILVLFFAEVLNIYFTMAIENYGLLNYRLRLYFHLISLS